MSLRGTVAGPCSCSGSPSLAALLIPLVTLGSYKRLLATEIHWGWLLGAGLAIQLGLEYYTLPRRYWHNVGFGLLVASYVLILAFCARNLVLRGMSIVLIGDRVQRARDRAQPGHAGEVPAGVAEPVVGAGDGEAPPAAARREAAVPLRHHHLEAPLRHRDVVRRPHPRGRAVRRRLQREPGSPAPASARRRRAVARMAAQPYASSIPGSRQRAGGCRA